MDRKPRPQRDDDCVVCHEQTAEPGREHCANSRCDYEYWREAAR